MPPKPKYSKEQIAAAAYSMIKEEGLSALTARELGSRLGTSVSPIFTIFRNMDEVKQAARALALAEFLEYIQDYKEYTPAFKRIGMKLVTYGMEEPELFKLLFMQEHEEPLGLENSIRDLGGAAEVCMELIVRDYKISPEDARLLFEQMWILAFGMGAMCAMGVCTMTQEEIAARLGMAFAGHVMLIGSGKRAMAFGEPEKNQTGTYHGFPVGKLPYL